LNYSELIAVDANGNVVCYDPSGKVVWDTSITGMGAQVIIILIIIIII